MSVIFARLVQFAVALGMLLLSSFGVDIPKSKVVAIEQGKERQISTTTEISLGAFIPPPITIKELSKEASSLVCAEKTYIAEFLACGEEIGLSVKKRPIYLFKINDAEESGKNRIVVLFIGGLHTGTEKNTYDLASKVLQHFYGNPERVPENITLYIIPKANPDGIVSGNHNNARGVDLNRNWPTEDWRSDPYHPTYNNRKGAGGKTPLSEPETKALYNFVKEVQPAMIFTWHSQAGTIEDNDVGQSHELAEIYAKAANYQHIKEWPHYVATGTFLVAMRETGIPAADVELATRNHEFDRNIKGVAGILAQLK